MIREAATAGGVVRSLERARIDYDQRTSVAQDLSFFDKAGRLVARSAGDGKVEFHPEGRSWRILVDTVRDGPLAPQIVTDSGRHAVRFFAQHR